MVANHHSNAATVAVAQVVFILVHVTECLDFLLRGQYGVANRALHAVSQAGLGACCRGTGHGFFGVTLSLDVLLRYQYGGTNGAMATCGLTCGSAGCLYCGILHHGVGVNARHNLIQLYSRLRTRVASETGARSVPLQLSRIVRSIQDNCIAVFKCDRPGGVCILRRGSLQRVATSPSQIVVAVLQCEGTVACALFYCQHVQTCRRSGVSCSNAIDR